MALSERIATVFWVTAKVVFVVIFCPAILLCVVCVAVWLLIYECLVPLQEHLSESKRRWTQHTNARNPATHLPPEIQLRIFRILAARAHFGRDDRGHRWLGPLDPPSPASLRACTLLCRAWYACATDVLYTDVSLCNAKTCILFARAVAGRPELARAVRRLELPREMRYLPDLTCEHAMQPVFSSKRFQLRRRRAVLWKDLKAAVDRLLVQCVNVDDLVLHVAGDLRRTTGLVQCLSTSGRASITRLALGSPQEPIRLNAPDVPWTVTTLEFPLPDYAGLFARIEFLSLYRHQLHAPDSNFWTFPALHTLELIWCELEAPYLHSLLAHAPNLRVLRLREIFWVNWQPFLRPLEEVISSPIQDRLTELSFRQCGGVMAGSLGGFTAVTVLTLISRLLPTLTHMPPQLHTLIVMGVLGWDGSIHTRASTRVILWQVVMPIKNNIDSWMEQAPDLKTIQLWDETDRGGIGSWMVIAFLLDGYLASRDISLDVNLTLDRDTQEHYEEKFMDQDRVRRFFWRDVL